MDINDLRKVLLTLQITQHQIVIEELTEKKTKLLVFLVLLYMITI